MYRPHFVYLFIQWWTLELPPPLVTVHNAAMNMGVQISVRVPAFDSSLNFNFLRNFFILFSIAAIPFYIPTSSTAQGFQVLHIFANTRYFLGFVSNNSHYKWDGMKWWFQYAFPWWLVSWASFHVLIHHWYIFFGELPIQVLCPFFFIKFFCCCCCCWVIGVLYIFWILTPYQIYDLQIFFLFHRLSFHSVDRASFDVGTTFISLLQCLQRVSDKYSYFNLI